MPLLEEKILRIGVECVRSYLLVNLLSVETIEYGQN